MKRPTSTDSGPVVPHMIGIRTRQFRPLLEKWRSQNPNVPWTCLLRDALRLELAALAGKRHAHLVAGQNGKERAA